MDIKGSKTEQNLKSAFAGESQARNKYTYYASQAKKEGWVEISKIVEAIANNEKEHAEIWFKLLHGGKMPGTQENLADCIQGENYEWTSMYQSFAEEARTEGFEAIAVLFEKIAQIERTHEKKFAFLLDQIQKDQVFKREKPIAWVCLNCGHVHFGPEAPEICPVCSHPKAYFAQADKE